MWVFQNCCFLGFLWVVFFKTMYLSELCNAFCHLRRSDLPWLYSCISAVISKDSEKQKTYCSLLIITACGSKCLCCSFLLPVLSEFIHARLPFLALTYSLEK